jgi:hypothetical protein
LRGYSGGWYSPEREYTVKKYHAEVGNATLEADREQTAQKIRSKSS